VGSGRDNRVTKNDILAYIENRNKNPDTPVKSEERTEKSIDSGAGVSLPKPALVAG
jgi:hypothetical protein